MTTLDVCDRCEGSGADPRQPLFSDEIASCPLCDGAGGLEVESGQELRLTA